MILTNPDSVTKAFVAAVSTIKFKAEFRVAFAHLDTYKREAEYWASAKTRIQNAAGEGVLVVIINPSPHAAADFAHCHNVMCWRGTSEELESHLRDEYALFIQG